MKYILFGFSMSVLLFIYGLGLIILGYIGIETYFDATWVAIAFLILAFFVRFTLPLMFGAIYGLMVTFGLNIWFSILIVAPSIVFILPSIVLYVLNRVNTYNKRITIYN